MTASIPFETGILNKRLEEKTKNEKYSGFSSGRSLRRANYNLPMRVGFGILPLCDTPVIKRMLLCACNKETDIIQSAKHPNKISGSVASGDRVFFTVPVVYRLQLFKFRL